jgi:hypothetical protein
MQEILTNANYCSDSSAAHRLRRHEDFCSSNAELDPVSAGRTRKVLHLVAGSCIYHISGGELWVEDAVVGSVKEDGKEERTRHTQHATTSF